MASINQLVSEISHSINQADNVITKRAIRLNIINVRAQLIRQQFSNHNYVDESLCQELEFEISADNNIISVPKPVRLDNNIPFLNVKLVNNDNKIISIPFIKNNLENYYSELPGMDHTISYSYNNDSIIINNINNNYKKLIINSVYEQPIDASINSELSIDDNYESFIPNDMVSNLKKLIMEILNPEIIRDTNEPNPISLIK